MKLITHNILMCNKKGCTKNNFPLKLAVKQFQDYESENAHEFSPALIQRLLEKIDWPALKTTVSSLDWGVTLPETYTQEQTQEEQFLRDLHLLLVKR